MEFLVKGLIRKWTFSGLITPLNPGTIKGPGGLMPILAAFKDNKVFLEGSINEDSNLKEIFDKLSGDIVLNLKGIKMANSVGIHRWIPLIAKYSAAHRVQIECLPYTLAIQAGLIHGLFGKSRILSALAPYRCVKCECEHQVEVDAKKLGKGEDEVPAAHCPSCASEMVFDELPQYFNFMRNPAA